MKAHVAAAVFAAAVVACPRALASGADIAPFSQARPGQALPEGWRPLNLARIAPPEVALVEDGGVTVLRFRAVAAAGTVAHDLDSLPAQRPLLSWRWKVDRVVERGNLAEKSGDDFAARVYVFYDLPVSSLPFGARVKVLLARAIWGEKLPTAAICYVWDNRHAPGTSVWNPYTDRVRTVVLRSGSPGAWVEEARDLEADFRAAFGSQWAGPAPRVTGIAIGNDTDQTGEAVTAWFGDFRLGARP
ncbi:MAG TPA: DUF3047 domain-containing protein [Usitatibacteraceae bacterium]|nr:DUF3047 domain-containing protein [Usitatibacteraceae bacterium]